MRSPGFLSQLQSQLESLPIDVLESVNQTGGLEIADMINYIIRPVDHTVYDPLETANVKNLDEVDRCPMTSNVALCLLLNSLNDIPAAKRILKNTKNETWLVVPKDNVNGIIFPNIGGDISILPRNETLGLTPDNQLASCRNGGPILFSCGSGDALASIISRGKLDQFLARGGQRIIFIDFAVWRGDIDLSLLVKAHVAGQKPITCTVTSRKSVSVTNVLCNYEGIDQIVECHRLALQRNHSNYAWTSSGAMVVEANLIDLSSIRWNWHRIKKNVEGQLVVQYERSLFDLTAIYQTQYINADSSKV